MEGMRLCVGARESDHMTVRPMRHAPIRNFITLSSVSRSCVFISFHGISACHVIGWVLEVVPALIVVVPLKRGSRSLTCLWYCVCRAPLMRVVPPPCPWVLLCHEFGVECNYILRDYKTLLAKHTCSKGGCPPSQAVAGAWDALFWPKPPF